MLLDLRFSIFSVELELPLSISFVPGFCRISVFEMTILEVEGSNEGAVGFKLVKLQPAVGLKFAVLHPIFALGSETSSWEFVIPGFRPREEDFNVVVLGVLNPLV
jgi:hypothetical protein